MQVFLLVIVFKDMERIETSLVLGHADQHIFLLLLGLLRGVEERMEDASQGLDFIDWASFLHVLFHGSFEIVGSLAIHRAGGVI